MSLELANIIIMVAASTNNVIGKDGDLPWNLPTDLKMFKETTKDHVVIMGRKCWESIPLKFRPLPNRTNIVLSRNKNYKAQGAHVRSNLVLAMEEFMYDGKDIFIIGGSEIYKEGFKYANKLYLTRVIKDIEGDTKLEGLVETDWLLESFEGPYKEDDLDFRFERYIRNDGNIKTDSSEE
jgi:dihydrofolate reductase